MKIPRNAREPLCLRAARQFIKDEGINWLPINPFLIARRHGWGPDTVGAVAKRSSLPRSKVMNGKDADTICVDGHCRIIYNERVRSKSRITWTIAHEIGHIVLGHLRDFEKVRVSRGGLAEEEYVVLEREADIFATELLAPMAILKALGAVEHGDIMKVCSISRDSAVIREREIRWHGAKQLYCEADAALTTQFSRYLTPVAICSTRTDLPLMSLVMQHEEVALLGEKKAWVLTDKRGRFKACPRCGNDMFSEDARYCRMCGLYLFNHCTNEESSGLWGNDCGMIQQGDARFCEKCGAETILYRLGLLMSWEEILSTYGDIMAGWEEVTPDIVAAKQEAAPTDDLAGLDINDDVPF